jgi:hypothetical protein
MYQLAQVNISPLKEPIDSLLLVDFVAQLDEINALAEACEGFVWRLQGEDGNATAYQVFDNKMIIMNMSVWESVESLRNYVYKTVHADVMKQGGKWFNKLARPQMALWWVPAGHIPTPQEAKENLAYLAENGETKEAFTFNNPFKM